MVDDNYIRNAVCKVRGLKYSEIVSIDNNQKSFRGDAVERFLAAPEHILILVKSEQSARTSREGVCALVGNDMDVKLLTADLLCKSRHTDTSAERVAVGVLVSHNENRFMICDKLANSLCNNSRADLFSLLDTLGATAVIVHRLFLFNYDLVSASLNRGIKRQLCVLLALKHGLTHRRDSHRCGNGHTVIAKLFGMNLLKQREALKNIFLEHLL